jgi:hypothetical protein
MMMQRQMMMMNQANPQGNNIPQPISTNQSGNIGPPQSHQAESPNINNTGSATTGSSLSGISTTGMNPNQQNNFQMFKNQMTSNPGIIPPMMRMGFNPRPIIYPNQFNSALPVQENKSQNVNDLIQNALSLIKSQTTSNEEQEENDISSIRDTPNAFEKDYSLEEENLKNIWGGFLTKNKKDRVCVDAYQIRNECTDYLNSEYNLNVSHRTQFEDIVKRPIIGIIAFSPQNATQCEIFQDYINYFNEKNRVGLINLKNEMILYLVPPSDFSRKFYQNPRKHLLGIFVNSNVEPKSYVDMSNLSLPPPVISLTEKRMLLKKNNQSNASSVSQPNIAGDKLNELSKILGSLEQDKFGKIILN